VIIVSTLSFIHGFGVLRVILNFDSTVTLTTQNVGAAMSVAGHAIIAEKLCIILKKSSSTVLDEEGEEWFQRAVVEQDLALGESSRGSKFVVVLFFSKFFKASPSAVVV
jgi:hypothetical protein